MKWVCNPVLLLKNSPASLASKNLFLGKKLPVTLLVMYSQIK